MPNEDRTNARQSNAWEARAKVDPDAVRGRSRGVFEVLCALTERGIHTTAQIAEKTGMKPRNAGRILLSLVLHSQVTEERPGYEAKEMPDGRTIPVRQPYNYAITQQGKKRMDWLARNTPWEKD